MMALHRVTRLAGGPIGINTDQLLLLRGQGGATNTIMVFAGELGTIKVAGNLNTNLPLLNDASVVSTFTEVAGAHE